MDNIAWIKYRLPAEDAIHHFSGTEQQGISAQVLKTANHFIYAPFSLEKTITGFKPEKQITTSVQPELEEYSGIHQSYSRQEYIALVNETVDRIKSGLFQKVVHSRFKFVEGNFNPEEIFNSLAQKFPAAFVYLLHSPALGTWCGATPERLLVQYENTWQTMALAGTRKWPDNNERWDEKDVTEQEIVARLIADKLTAANLRFDKSKPYTKPAGNIAHICTDFVIDNNNPYSFVELAQQLHPTPAICGYPVHAAYLRIHGVEKNTRELYSGMLGISTANNGGQLYVNLRCMRVFKNGVRLHAGGGINALSNAEKEWDETELKMHNILSAFQA